MMKKKESKARKSKAFDESFSNGFEKTKLELSHSVSNVQERFSDPDPVSASAIIRDILNDHINYMGGKAKQLPLEETSQKLSITEWLKETLSNIAGGIAAAGSAIGQVLVKASPIGFLFW